jgi:hypothetical protein
MGSLRFALFGPRVGRSPGFLTIPEA